MRLAVKRTNAASLLFGLAVALLVFSVGFALVLAPFRRAQRLARAQATLVDLHTYAVVFQDYAHDHGDWPAESSGPAETPPGLETALAATHWRDPTPLGGRYAWLANTTQRGERIRAAIGIVSVAGHRVSDEKPQLDLLRQLAPQMQLEPNRLRLGFMNQPVYVLEH